MNEKTRLSLNRIRHLGRSAMPWTKDILIYCKKYDLFFKSHKRDGIGKDISYKFGYYAEDYVNQFFVHKLNLRPGGIMLDVGANIGWYSIVMAQQSQLNIYAFEPHPFNYSMLKENIRLNKSNNIKSFPYAIAENAGTMKLHIYKSYNMGRHSLINHGKTDRFHEVETISIDDFMEKNKLDNEPVEMLKIDIEGYEMAALRGAKKTLARTRFVFSEFSPAIMKSIHESPRSYIDLMKSYGFEGHIIDNESSCTPVSYNELEKYESGVHNIFWSRTSL